MAFYFFIRGEGRGGRVDPRKTREGQLEEGISRWTVLFNMALSFSLRLSGSLCENVEGGVLMDGFSRGEGMVS